MKTWLFALVAIAPLSAVAHERRCTRDDGDRVTCAPLDDAQPRQRVRARHVKRGRCELVNGVWFCGGRISPDRPSLQLFPRRPLALPELSSPPPSFR